MSLIRINFNPSGRQLKVFGIAWLLFVGAWGCVAAAKANAAVAYGLWTVAAGIPLVGFFFPPALQRTYIALSYVSYPIGFVVSHVVVAICYYIVLTPIGLLLRLFRYDPLARNYGANTPTYWQRRTKRKSVTDYFRQS